jgi:hypothetical protein
LNKYKWRIKLAITQRENLQLVFDHKQPEWVPLAEESLVMTMNGFLMSWYQPGVIVSDLFGAKYFNADPRIGPMTIPGEPLITDIHQWRDVVTIPDLSQIDWEAEAAKDTSLWDRDNKMSMYMASGSASGAVFQLMVTLMSHEGALYALADEDSEEEWHALLSTLIDWTCEVVKNTIKYYKPDICCICDDNSSKNSSFMSPATFRRMIKPYHKKLVDTVIEGGCIPTLHCCGNINGLFDDFIDVGYKGWDPSQVQNNLTAMKEKTGTEFVYFGGFDSQGSTNKAGTSEEDVRAAIASSFDILAPNGGYVFSTSGMMLPWDIGDEQAGWIMDEARHQSKTFYQK